MYDRAACEIHIPSESWWGDLSQGELEGGNWRDREENKKTQSNEIFTPF